MSSDNKLIRWVSVPSKIGGKPRRRLYEYGGYLVCLPAYETGEGTYTPIEEFEFLPDSVGSAFEREDEMPSEHLDDLKRVESFFRSGSVIMAGLRGKPEVGSQCVKSSLEDRANLCDLEALESSDISFQVRQRYYKDKIYTYIGSILVTVNPYKLLNFVEGPFKGQPLDCADSMRTYLKGAYSAFKGLPPHIFAIAARAYSQCTDSNQNQSVIISGESGSGKTVATRLVLKFLQAVSSSHESATDSKKISIEEKIGFTNPILESFGNAKTLRNNNSSRFGKWMEIILKKGRIAGANIEQYLLEKSRVTTPGKGERNYHIFYMLCLYIRNHPNSWLAKLAEDEKLGYKLADYESGSVRYLIPRNGEAEYTADGWDDEGEMEKVLEGLEGIGMKESDEDIFKVIACVLHLGNITFEGDEDSSVISEESLPIVHHCAQLLQTDSKTLATSLTTGTLSVRGQVTQIHQGKSKSERSRDALAKHLYRSLFSWVVLQLSKRLHKSGDKARFKHVGVLDIFGFEDFGDENFFEQLCINYANERLQGNFNKHIFEEELKLYKQEEMPANILEKMAVECPDNKLTLRLMKRMTEILNEGTNRTPMPDLRQKFKDEGLDLDFGKYARKDGSFEMTSYDTHFAIHHYAGRVEYRYKDMLERNDDKLLPSLRTAAEKSTSSFIRSLFPAESRVQNKKKMRISIIKLFHKSLQDLMVKLNLAQPHYVRCLKPNVHKLPKMFHTSKVLDQMKCAGLFEAVKIRKAGFPNRMSLERFIQSFGPVVPETVRTAIFSGCSNDRQRANKLLEQLAKDSKQLAGEMENVFAGKNNVMMRSSYWAKVHVYRQEAMKGQFIEAVKSRSISKLESVVRRAENLDLHFEQAILARNFLNFLKEERKCVLTHIPELCKVVDLNHFLASKQALEEELVSYLVPVVPDAVDIQPLSLSAYIDSKDGAKLRSGWVKLEEWEQCLRNFFDFKQELQTITKPQDDKASLASLERLRELIKREKTFPSMLLHFVSDEMRKARQLEHYLNFCGNLLRKIKNMAPDTFTRIEAVCDDPLNAKEISKLKSNIEAIEGYLQDLSTAPLAKSISIAECEESLKSTETGLQFSKLRLQCLSNVASLLAEAKRFGGDMKQWENKGPNMALASVSSPTSSSRNAKKKFLPLNIEEEELSSRVDRGTGLIQKIKINFEELQDLGRAHKKLSDTASDAIVNWFEVYMQRVSGIETQRTEAFEKAKKNLNEAKELVNDLSLPEDLGGKDLLVIADELLGDLSEQQSKMEADTEKRKRERALELARQEEEERERTRELRRMEEDKRRKEEEVRREEEEKRRAEEERRARVAATEAAAAAKAAAEARAKEEAEERANAEAARQAQLKAEAEERARVVAEEVKRVKEEALKAKEDLLRAKEQADRARDEALKAKEEAQRAKAEAEAEARAAEYKARVEAEARAKAEAERQTKAKELAEARAKSEAEEERKAKEEAEKAKEEAAKAKAEALRAKQEAKKAKAEAKKASDEARRARERARIEREEASKTLGTITEEVSATEAYGRKESKEEIAERFERMAAQRRHSGVFLQRSRSLNAAMLMVKSQVQSKRKTHLRDQANKLLKHIKQSHRQLTLINERLAELEGPNKANPYKANEVLSLSEVYEHALRDTLRTGRIRDVAGLMVQMRSVGCLQGVDHVTLGACELIESLLHQQLKKSQTQKVAEVDSMRFRCRVFQRLSEYFARHKNSNTSEMVRVMQELYHKERHKMAMSRVQKMTNTKDKNERILKVTQSRLSISSMYADRFQHEYNQLRESLRYTMRQKDILQDRIKHLKLRKEYKAFGEAFAEDDDLDTDDDENGLLDNSMANQFSGVTGSSHGSPAAVYQRQSKAREGCRNSVTAADCSLM